MLPLSHSQNHYEPNNGISTNLKEGNEINLLASVSDLSFSNSNYQFQGGYSPLKGVGIQVGYYSNKTRNFNQLIKERTLRGWNTAMGLYHFSRRNSLFNRRYKMEYPNDFYFARQKLKMNPGILVEAYLGYGQGNATNDFGEDSESNFEFNKRYLQLGLFWFDKFWGAGYFFRMGQLHFNSVQAELIGPTKAELSFRFMEIITNNPYRLQEHTARFFIGTRKIKLVFNYNFQFQNSNFSNFGMTRSNYKIGINVGLTDFF